MHSRRYWLVSITPAPGVASQASAVDILATSGGTTREPTHVGGMSRALDLAECCRLRLEALDGRLASATTIANKR